MNIIEVYKLFPTHESCLDHLEKVKWQGEPSCPYCTSKRSTPLPKERRHHCNKCNTSYSVTVQTIFHKTKLDLQLWFVAISLVLNAKKGISSRQLGRDIGVNKNTSWYMLMRIRRAMRDDGEMLQGIVEADETYIGGKNKNKHKSKKKAGRGTIGKVPVFGMVERGGKVKAQKVSNVQGCTIQPIIEEQVLEGSVMMTDESSSYKDLSTKFNHLVVNHGHRQYVKGEAYTNTIEGFWSLFKRGLIGQYHQISVKHLNKYIDEFCFRYNNRDNKSAFDTLLLRSLTL